MIRHRWRGLLALGITLIAVGAAILSNSELFAPAPSQMPTLAVYVEDDSPDGEVASSAVLGGIGSIVSAASLVMIYRKHDKSV